MHAQTAVVDFAQAVGGDLPVLGHATQWHALAQFTDVGLAAVSAAIHVGDYIHKEVTIIEFKFHAAVGRSLGP